ncbi:MAG: FAD-dependent thymidylate synthase [Rickettsiales bacterium]|jgi:thymidylate synthase (FAD)|nr:FAD-dependent thymidylate synthase [Rickettsiales bacterium]
MVKVLKPSYEILTPIDGTAILKHIEKIARTCYKSEDKITPPADDSSARKMIANLIKMGHEAMIEHFSISVRFTADMGFYKDLTRHRIASFAIESTRYCMYANEKFGSQLSVMEPPLLEPGTDDYNVWLKCMEDIEGAYNELARRGYKPDVCRMVLPHSIKADINVTANLREWRHIFKLRTSTKAHPTIYTLLIPLLVEFKKRIPVIFDDIEISREIGEAQQKVIAYILAERDRQLEFPNAAAE